MRRIRLPGRLAPIAAILCGAAVAAVAADAARPAQPAADAGGCARVHKALENVVTTPGHSYTTETSSQRGTKRTETIYLDGRVYVLSNARWIQSPVSSRQMLDELRRSGKHATLACKAAGEETVEERTATVYTTTSQTGDSRTESRLWIDKVSGLLLRQEEDLSGGGQTVHRSTRYEYGNVKAPKLAD